MRSMWSLFLVLSTVAAVSAEDKANRKLLLVTHSGGFIHDSVGVAEDILKEIGPKHGYDVTCWRFTGQPDVKVKFKRDKNGPEVEATVLEKYSEDFRARTGKTVDETSIGRINAKTLKGFDIVLFFTTGTGTKLGNIGPVNDDELKDLLAWVKAGGAFAGTHCATDTLYDTPYSELIGGYFKSHPSGLQDIKIKIEDAKHPAAVGFTDGQAYKDEMYIFKDKPYSRDKLHIILSCEPGSFNVPKNIQREDGDYAISWCHELEKGKVFYTSFGHDKKVWKDSKFQEHLIGGLNWSTGVAKGDATPSAKLKK